MIDIEIIEFAVAIGGVALFTYLGAKYGAAIYAKLSGVAGQVEGIVNEIEAGFPAEGEKDSIYGAAKAFLADAKDMLSDGQVSIVEMRRQVKDGEALYGALMDMYVKLKGGI